MSENTHTDKTFTQEQLANATKAVKEKYEAELTSVKSELEGFKEKETERLAKAQKEERDSHIISLVSDITDADKLGFALTKANILETDDDETIKFKVNKVIESHPFLKKDVVDPEAAKALTSSTTNINKITKEKEDTFAVRVKGVAV